MKFTLISAMLLTAMAGVTSVNAADYKKNPFTLAYDGAITENVKGKVNIHPVKYDLHGIQIAANVYTPANYDPAKKYPAVVVAHPNGGVKEQVAGLYAQRLAEQGYITITADAAYQGASGGMPRSVDKPANRIEDIHGMADYISQYPGVDTSRLGLLGICGGGGIHWLPPRRTNGSNRLQLSACLIQVLCAATVCRIHSWRLSSSGFSRLLTLALRKQPEAKCFTPAMPT